MAWEYVVPILQVGIAGLAFLLAFLGYRLLAKEVEKPGPARAKVLKAVRAYTGFTILMALLVAIAKPVELAIPKLLDILDRRTNPTPAPVDYSQALNLKLLLGEVDGKPRGRIVPATENDKLLASKFQTAQRSIKVVTETGSTWLLSHLEPILNSAVMRDVEIEVLTHDYRNKDVFGAMQQSMLGNNLTIYPVSHYRDKLVEFQRYYSESPNFKVGVHRFYPWTRFTIFDGQSVSFVFTPTLNGGSEIQRMYSEDKIVVSMFEALYKSIREGSLVFATVSELQEYTKLP